MATYDPPPPHQPYNTSAFVTAADAQPTTEGDRWGLIAITVAVMALLSCVPLLNCLVPFAPLTAGIVALVRAKSAANPSRARTYGWIATIFGGLLVLALLVILGLYGAVIIQAINQAQRGTRFQTSP